VGGEVSRGAEVPIKEKEKKEEKSNG